MVLDASFWISIVAIIVAGSTFYFSFLKPKRAKIGFTGPFFSPNSGEWGIYIINTGNQTALLDVKETKVTINKREFIGKIRNVQEMYQLKHPKEYYLCWINYEIYEPHLISSDVEVKFYFDIKYFNGKKFKRKIKKLDPPREDFYLYISPEYQFGYKKE